MLPAALLKAIKAAFEKPLPNAARLQTRKIYSFPMIEDTKCPKLDTVVKQNLSKDVKDSDVNVAKLQTLMLDAVAPLVHILEEAQRGTLTLKTATDRGSWNSSRPFGQRIGT